MQALDPSLQEDYMMLRHRHYKHHNRSDLAVVVQIAVALKEQVVDMPMVVLQRVVRTAVAVGQQEDVGPMKAGKNAIPALFFFYFPLIFFNLKIKVGFAGSLGKLQKPCHSLVMVRKNCPAAHAIASIQVESNRNSCIRPEQVGLQKAKRQG